ncbi:hypothetical protein [Streptomyces sp. NPDC088915]|uniref:hypothetical protein n=1 Tax=Streptomyces sp. NPDC088915 TaxID=3365912 RepID=UPI0038267F52
MQHSTRERLIYAARATAAYLVTVVHALITLAAALAAGTYTWQHGHTLPFDTTATAALNGAVAVGVLVAGALGTVPEALVLRLRYAVWGRPLAHCPTCGGLAEPPAEDTTSKETVQ